MVLEASSLGLPIPENVFHALFCRERSGDQGHLLLSGIYYKSQKKKEVTVIYRKGFLPGGGQETCIIITWFIYRTRYSGLT